MNNLETIIKQATTIPTNNSSQEISKLLRVDYFSTKKPKQPKKEIADYVEKKGITVPRRFNSLKEALEEVKKGKNIIIRSEHPDEYEGPSGLLESIVINPEDLKTNSKIDIEEFQKPENSMDTFKFIEKFKKIIGNISEEEVKFLLTKLSYENIVRYCEYNNIDINNFIEDISFSYWEYIEGVNSTIIADTNISNRYHIIRNTFPKYTIIDNGDITIMDLENETFEILKNMDEYKGKKIKIGNEVIDLSWSDKKEYFRNLLEFYERIRQLDKFDPFHCPAIEIQEGKKGPYFLQYHRIQDLDESNFTLDREKEEDEIEAIFVRGTTPKEGIIVNTTVLKSISQTDKIEGALNIFSGGFYLELLSRNLKLNIVTDRHDGKCIADGLIDGHLGKSIMFKPKLTVFTESGNIPGSVYKKDNIKVRVISDGRKAYLKFIEK